MTCLVIKERMDNSCFPCLLFLSRNVVAESDDVIKAAVDGLSKNGFINYYGLQVQEIYHFLLAKFILSLRFCVRCSSSSFIVIPFYEMSFLFVILRLRKNVFIVFGSALVVVQYLLTLLVLLCLEESGDMLSA